MFIALTDQSQGEVMSARVDDERKEAVATRSTWAYLVLRARHDEFSPRARSTSLSLLLKLLNLPAGRQCVGSKINHRNARAARDIAPCDRGNKLCV